MPLDVPVSVFQRYNKPALMETVPLAVVLGDIQRGAHRTRIEALREWGATYGKDKTYDDTKRALPGFTPAGVFTYRANAKLTTASGLVHFDFDHPPNLAEAKARLMEDPWIAYAFVSPSGDGLKVAVWATGIADDTTYKHAWGTVLAYFHLTYPDMAVANDKACKDIARLCFVSHDPELYSNPDARLYAVPPYQAPAPKPKAPRTVRPQAQSTGAGEQARVEDALLVIPADDYDTWLRVGMALHASGEAWARAAWDIWSQRSDKYDAAMQDAKWSSFTPDGAVTLATVFHLAQQHGYAPARPSMTVGRQPQSGTPPAPANTTTAAGATAQQWGTQTRPEIKLNTEMTRIIDETQAALLALPEAPVIYQRARHLSVIARGVKPPKWLHRPHDMPVILEASTARLTELARQAADYWKLDKRSRTWELALPPGWVIETLHSRAEWPFPVLEGIIASPTLRPDGSLLNAPGYDAETGLYLDTNGTTFPHLPDRPTLDDARSAIGHLQEAVKDFPFTEPWHFSASLTAILSLVCRFAIQGNVPLFPIRATTRGSGKSLLADVISIIGTGSAAPRWPQVKEDEEERKRLLTVALAGYPCLHIDNVVRPLGSPALDLALTSSTFSDRLLGVNEARTAPLHMVWLASGNNMQFYGDTARRIVPIDLDPRMERPEERTDFTHTPLLPWIHQERPRLTMAALIIVKAYFEAGCPAQALTAMGSFEAWSDLIRQALVWAGEADPNEGRKDLESESNPEYEQLAQLLDAWEACYPIPQGTARSAAKTLSAVLADIAALKMMDKPPVLPGKLNAPNEYDALQDALGAYDAKYDRKTVNPRPVGDAFRKFQGRTIAGHRFIADGESHHAKCWCVENL